MTDDMNRPQILLINPFLTSFLFEANANLRFPTAVSDAAYVACHHYELVSPRVVKMV